MTVGEALVKYLEARGIELIFGIPGVHTIELYRGLAQAKIRHVTARHEQGVGFMADGYARASGQVGVAFVITGPGITNTLTAMAQARADSIPMLVISGVNERASLGRGLGHLHELPDQLSLCKQVACTSTQITQASELIPALEQAFSDFASKRPGPVHIEIPTDVMSLPFGEEEINRLFKAKSPPSPLLQRGVPLLSQSKHPIILAGGGAKAAEQALQQLAERLAAPVILTANARGLLHKHPLCIPASASMEAVRVLIREADCVLAVGTELGFTDYDVYRDNNFPELNGLIRIDICAQQLQRHAAEVTLQGDAAAAMAALLAELPEVDQAQLAADTQAAQQRAATIRANALAELPAAYYAHVQLLNALRDHYPAALMVGDSTQVIYAANLYYDHDRAGGWFNAATGFGSLGYGIPAAIGAALAQPEQQVICLTGDGGAQFTLPELMTAVQEQLPIIFIVWNNKGYLEIEYSMAAVDIEVIGCDPLPPDFAHIAKACGLPYAACTESPELVVAALESLAGHAGPVMVEIVTDR